MAMLKGASPNRCQAGLNFPAASLFSCHCRFDTWSTTGAPSSPKVAVSISSLSMYTTFITTTLVPKQNTSDVATAQAQPHAPPAVTQAVTETCLERTALGTLPGLMPMQKGGLPPARWRAAHIVNLPITEVMDKMLPPKSVPREGTKRGTGCVTFFSELIAELTST